MRIPPRRHPEARMPGPIGRRTRKAPAIAALILLCGGVGAPHASSSPVSGPSPRALQAASQLLGRLQASPRSDLLAVRELGGSRAEGGFVVHTYPELRPAYTLVPIRASGGDVLGVISVAESSGQWAWYALGYRDGSFPRESAERAALRLPAPFRAGSEAIAVRLPDKRVYWMFSRAGDGARILYELDRPEAPPLSTLDGSLQRHLQGLPKLARPLPPPGRSSAEPQGGRRDRPAVCLIPHVPFHFQSTSWYCGCASVQMLFDHYGEEIGQNDISDVENDIVGWGTYTDDNRRACHFSGMSAALQNPALRGYRERQLGYAGNEAWLHLDPYNQLKDLMVQGTPVEICTCYDGSCDSGHFRVVKGYDDTIDEFVVHDPWYGSPFYGPDVHFNQQFLVQNLWDPWTSCWALMTGPWDLRPISPSQVEPSGLFQVSLDIVYPGRGPFQGQYPAEESSASIELPEGFALAGGSSTVSLPTLSSGDSVRVSWDVVAGAAPGRATIAFRARGIVTGSTYYSYPSYSDSIGGRCRAEVQVGQADSSSWTTAERLTDTEAASSTAYPNGRSLFVAASGMAHAVYSDAREGNSEIYYRRWDGAWSPEVRLTDAPAASEVPVIAGTAAGHLFVAWSDRRLGNSDIYVKTWDGLSWSDDTRISTTTCSDTHPSIAVDGLGRVHLAWQSVASGWTLVYYSRLDGGSWSTPAILAGGTGNAAFMPSVAADASGKVYLLYERDTSNRGPADIYCKIYDGAWSGQIQLCSDPSYSHCPSAAVGPDGTLHVVWYDGRDLGGDIFYRSYDGVAWSEETVLVEHAGDSQYASVAVDAMGRPGVAWVDYRDGNAEIYHKRWSGTSWTEDERITREGHDSTLPCLAMDSSGRSYLLWTDLRAGNAEVFSSRQEPDPAGIDWWQVNGDRFEPALMAWPSPAFRGSRLRLRLLSAGPVCLRLYDVGGRRVRTLLQETLPAGPRQADWDGLDDAGRPVGAGVYVWRLDGPDGSGICRMVVAGR